MLMWPSKSATWVVGPKTNVDEQARVGSTAFATCVDGELIDEDIDETWMAVLQCLQCLVGVAVGG